MESFDRGVLHGFRACIRLLEESGADKELLDMLKQELKEIEQQLTEK